MYSSSLPQQTCTKQQKFFGLSILYTYINQYTDIPLDGYTQISPYKQTTAKTDIQYLTHLTRKQLEISDKAYRIPELKSELLL